MYYLNPSKVEKFRGVFIKRIYVTHIRWFLWFLEVMYGRTLHIENLCCMNFLISESNAVEGFVESTKLFGESSKISKTFNGAVASRLADSIQYN